MKTLLDARTPRRRSGVAILLAIGWFCLFGFVAMGVALTARAQTVPVTEPVPEVDTAAVQRMGNMVQYLGDGITANSDQDVWVEALAMPADDNHKWFISVITDANCAPCKRLMNDWAHDEWLRTFAKPENHKESWAFFNEYRRTDEAGMRLFTQVKIEGYPTLIVQPPRNGKYGPPGNVVKQLTGYDGDPKKLARTLSDAIKLYLSKRRAEAAPVPVGPAPVGTPSFNRGFTNSRRGYEGHDDADGGATANGAESSGGFGQVANRYTLTPPWSPKPKDDPAPTVLPSAPLAPTPGGELVFPTFPPAVNPGPSPKPATPATPDDAEVDPSDTVPEIIVVADADEGKDVLDDPKVKGVIARMKQAGGGSLKVRVQDWHNAREWLPVQRDQLPAVFRTAQGKVVDKVSNVLQGALSGVAPDGSFPIEAIIAFVTSLASGGFSWVALAALAGALLVWWRKRKQTPPATPINELTVGIVKPESSWFDELREEIKDLRAKVRDVLQPATKSGDSPPKSPAA